MARTKQTARKCLVSSVARKSTASKGVRKMPKLQKRSRSGRSRSLSSDSENDDAHVVNNQQFSVKFDDQDKCERECVTSKIFACNNCEAVFTSQSKTIAKGEYQKMKKDKNLPDQKKQKFLNNFDSVWICEFCLSHNSLPKQYKAPSVENPCFLIQKAKKSKKNGKDQEDQNKILIFCIDVSGSMDLRVAGTKSRLDTVKQAIIDEINRMKFEKEVLKVGLVTFGSFVTLIGDGQTYKQKNLDSSIYHQFDAIVKQCSKIAKFASPIQKSYDSLKKRIQNLGIYGSTALGPGLLSSIQIASKGGVGSKVIICTDGQANVGIGGSFSLSSGDKNNENFYEKAADFAKKKRVSVSILSLKGDKCNLKQLGKLSLATGGSVLKIDPKALGTQFSKIAKEQILGTESKLVIKVNKIFEIVSHIPTELSQDKTTLTQQFGNFSKQTELTFQFKVLSKQEASSKPTIDMDLYNQQKVPMQIQLTYLGRDGSRYKQIITDWRQLTQNQKQVYQGANFGLFSASVLQRASSKIKSAQFKDAQKVIKGYWSLVQKKFSKSESVQELKKFGDRIKKLQTILNSKMKKSGAKVGVKKATKKASKIKKIAKSSSKKQLRKRSRSRDGSAQKNKKKKRAVSDSSSQSNSSDSQDGDMSSDQQEQILWRQMRARSRSRSNSPPAKSKDKKKTTKATKEAKAIKAIK